MVVPETAASCLARNNPIVIDALTAYACDAPLKPLQPDLTFHHIANYMDHGVVQSNYRLRVACIDHGLTIQYLDEMRKENLTGRGIAKLWLAI